LRRAVVFLVWLYSQQRIVSPIRQGLLLEEKLPLLADPT